MEGARLCISSAQKESVGSKKNYDIFSGKINHEDNVGSLTSHIRLSISMVSS